MYLTPTFFPEIEQKGSMIFIFVVFFTLNTGKTLKMIPHKHLQEGVSLSLFSPAFITPISTFEIKKKIKANFLGFFSTAHPSLITQFTEHWLLTPVVCTWIPALFTIQYLSEI